LCMAGYMLQVSNNTCVINCNVNECNSCSQPNFCASNGCNPTFTNFNNTGTIVASGSVNYLNGICILCNDPNCVVCTTNFVCGTCASSSFTVSWSGTCVICPTNCAICSSNATCLSCVNAFY
jgi:hypothetical protein